MIYIQDLYTNLNYNTYGETTKKEQHTGEIANLLRSRIKQV